MGHWSSVLSVPSAVYHPGSKLTRMPGRQTVRRPFWQPGLALRSALPTAMRILQSNGREQWRPQAQPYELPLVASSRTDLRTSGLAPGAASLSALYAELCQTRGLRGKQNFGQNGCRSRCRLRAADMRISLNLRSGLDCCGASGVNGLWSGIRRERVGRWRAVRRKPSLKLRRVCGCWDAYPEAFWRCFP